jgi:hypothetical protein
MRRDLLCPEIQARLKRLPAPHAAHYGVVPSPPPSTLPLFDSIRVLTERTGYQKHRLFVAPEVLSLLNRPFGHAPVLPSANPIPEPTAP